jgi:hypothetical protein
MHKADKNERTKGIVNLETVAPLTLKKSSICVKEKLD